jgi:uncharacterized protein (TIGR03000 family)
LEGGSRLPLEATIVVRLPADATLTVDDNPTRSTSGLRLFVTPPLPAGQDFSYTLKARAVRNGRAVEVEKQVKVRGGEEAEVELTLPAGGAPK